MNNNDQYLKSLSKRKVNRIISWLCIVVIVALVIATCVTGIMGSQYFMGFLVLMILVPIIFYVVLWIGRLLFNYGGTEIEFVEQDLEEDNVVDLVPTAKDNDSTDEA